VFAYAEAELLVVEVDAQQDAVDWAATQNFPA
jgi:hypothetical protein